ncbi:class I tRNA ligase family protein [Kitasatospora sp. NPDC059599]|uniref:class I tRNA ligase family protein n=1 Tax=Kitasatospora sp. NPDC059599 TaxID=3346880 RepID=UPI0036C54D01
MPTADPSATVLFAPSNPTPNGDLHVGHLAGPFVAADVARRCLEFRGGQGRLLLGTAWMNTHVMFAAERAGVPYPQYADLLSERIWETFRSAAVEPDVALRGADAQRIGAVVLEMLGRARESGAVRVRTRPAHYCVGCADWRFQGYVSGSCPHCGTAGAAGIDCEACALHHDDCELVGGTCAVCGGATELRPLRRLYLLLEPLRGELAGWLAGAHLSPAARRYADRVLARELPEVPVSYVSALGIAVPERPGEGVGGQSVYPAFELAGRYQVMVEQAREAGIAPQGSPSAMFFGFDNAFERLFILPAVLLAAGTGVAPLPSYLDMSYFYRLDGAKFSTSRNHLVWARDLVARSCADEARLYTSLTRPENNETDFTMEEFLASPVHGLAARLLAWAEELGAVVPRAGGADAGGSSGAGGSDAGGTDAGGAGQLGQGPAALTASCATWAQDLWRAYRLESFSCRSAAHALLRLVLDGQEALALAAGAPAREAAEYRALALRVLRTVAVAGLPFLPQTCAVLRGRLGLAAQGVRWDGTLLDPAAVPGDGPAGAPADGPGAAGAVVGPGVAGTVVAV